MLSELACMAKPIGVSISLQQGALQHRGSTGSTRPPAPGYSVGPNIDAVQSCKQIRTGLRLVLRTRWQKRKFESRRISPNSFKICARRHRPLQLQRHYVTSEGRRELTSSRIVCRHPYLPICSCTVSCDRVRTRPRPLCEPRLKLIGLNSTSQ